MNHSATYADPTLFDVLRDIWSARRALVLGGGLGVLAALLFLSFAVPQYRITMIVAPAERAAKADIKALLPNNPSFALQYLVNTVGSADSTDFIRFENILRAPSVARRVMADPAIRAGFEQSGRFVFSRAPDIDSAERISTLMEDQIRIEPIGNTPLRRVTFDHPSAEFGVALLTRLYAESDHLIRAEVAEKARNRAAYLKDMLDRINHPDHRRALTSLLMEQEHILMILAMDEPFSAIIAEPPSVSVKPQWPRKSMILAGFIFAGMVLGYAVRGIARAR